MNNYASRYAELYDLFYADKPYADEARFVHECIREFAPHPAAEILELACGTGRHALELKNFGYQITATDRSPDMLRVARHRLGENGTTFVASDMRDLQLPAREYDAAVCLFDSIGYLQTDDAIHDAFGKIRDHLRENGLLIFEFWHAPAMLARYSPTRRRSWKTSDGEIVRTSATALDRVRRLARVHYTVEEIRNDATRATFHEEHINRFFSVDEMKALVSEGGFEPIKFFAGFDRLTPITDEIWHIVTVARKK